MEVQSQLLANPSQFTTTTPLLSQIFVDGVEPVKFFLQQDTGEDFLAWLASKIIEHGGIVVQAVPIKGYVLIDPDTNKGRRLRDKWQIPEKPNRHVVCYTFVRACIVAGTRIPTDSMKNVIPFFKFMNVPVEIFLHPSLNKEQAQSIAVEIEKAGGVTETTEERARVIIAPHKTKQEAVLWKDLNRKYEHFVDKFVEDLDWVKECLAKQRYENTPQRPRNMGGRKPGSIRIEYTDEDDQNLVKYIARRIPNPALGGRLGNNLYIDLTERSSEYPWGQRHSWHSWRNRYKTRQLIFDVAVSEWLSKNPLPEGLKGRMLYQRFSTSGPPFETGEAASSGDTGNAIAPPAEDADISGEQPSAAVPQSEPQPTSELGQHLHPEVEQDPEVPLRPKRKRRAVTEKGHKKRKGESTGNDNGGGDNGEGEGNDKGGNDAEKDVDELFDDDDLQDTNKGDEEDELSSDEYSPPSAKKVAPRPKASTVPLQFKFHPLSAQEAQQQQQ